MPTLRNSKCCINNERRRVFNFNYLFSINNVNKENHIIIGHSYTLYKIKYNIIYPMIKICYIIYYKF